MSSSIAARPDLGQSTQTKVCGAQHCIGCPAAGRHVLEAMLGSVPSECGFDSLPVEARSPLPSSWPSRYGFAIVRRGWLVRQRIAATGHATAIDAIGPGCCFRLEDTSTNGSRASSSGYAVTRALVCLCDPTTLERGLAEGGPTAIQVHQLHAEAVTRMERLADARGRPNASSKVAALLCALTDTLRPGSQAGGPIPAELQQRDLAGLLSVRHETVCRVLREFADEKLITRDSEGITLLDRAQLDLL